MSSNATHADLLHARLTHPHAVNAIVMRDGLVLACARRHGDLWSLPGGKIGEAESPLDALLRELREETGIEAASSSCMFFHEGLCHSVDPSEKSYWVYSYLCQMPPAAQARQMPGEPPIRWMDPKEFLESTAFPEFNAQMFRRIGVQIKG